MIRTRDFFLFILAFLFLVLAIGATRIWHHHSGGEATWWPSPDMSPPQDYEAEVYVPPETDYETNIKKLREKIAARGATISAPKEEVIEEPKEEVATTTMPSESATTTAKIMTCANYATLNISWQPQSIKQEVKEGVRLYSETVSGAPPATASTTPASNEKVRALLPLRTWPLTTKQCLSSDVIGIALDGSLIRNNEHKLYAVFGAETLIGYSLDGYPIYGTTPTVKVDDCGGALVGGSYRYIVDAKREGVINCFVGTPASLQ